MDVKKSLPLAAALLALGITGPAAALASDGDSEHAPDAGSVVSAPAGHPGEDQSDDSVAEEQRSGEPGDDQNSDLASEVEQEDANTSTDDDGEDHSATPTADSQSDDQDDQANSDLAAEVEQEDGAGSGDANQETEVEDSNDD